MRIMTIDKKTGINAIEYAEAHGLSLSKYTDPTEGARDSLTPDEAREIAAYDPSLIYISTKDLVGVEAPWASKWAEVDGEGVKAFESISDYRTWMAQA